MTAALTEPAAETDCRCPPLVRQVVFRNHIPRVDRSRLNPASAAPLGA